MSVAYTRVFTVCAGDDFFANLAEAVEEIIWQLPQELNVLQDVGRM